MPDIGILVLLVDLSLLFVHLDLQQHYSTFCKGMTSLDLSQPGMDIKTIMNLQCADSKTKAQA
jgi:hypothetical protein